MRPRLWMLSSYFLLGACDVPVAETTLDPAVSTRTAPMIASDCSDALLGEAASSSFLAEFERHPLRAEEGGVAIEWHYSGAPSILWVEGQPLPFGHAKCTGGERHERVLCFLASHDALFGYGGALVLDRETPLPDGRSILRFGQTLEGVRVHGADVVVTVAADGGGITRVASSFVRGLLPRAAPGASFAAGTPEPDGEQASAWAGRDVIVTGSPVARFVVDQSARACAASAEWFMDVLSNDGVPLRLRLTADTFAIAGVEELRAGLPQTVVTSESTRVAHSTIACTLDSQCTPYGLNECLVDPYLVDRCVEACTTSGDCTAAFGAGWSCETAGAFSGYCTSDLDAVWQVVYDDTAGGHQGDSDTDRHLKWAADGMLTWRDFLEFEWGRDSWDDNDGALVMNLGDACLTTCGTAYGGGGNIWMPNWYPFDDDSLDRLANRFHIIGHEGGHSVIQSIAGGFGDWASCTSETLPQLVGALLARRNLPTETWSNGAYVDSAWLDQTCGLNPCGLTGSRNMPYAHRSRYDWLPCPEETQTWGPTCTTSATCGPFEQCLYDVTSGWNRCTNKPSPYNNRELWLRMARIMAEGSATFARDGHGENLGLDTFAGLGNSLTADIVYEALLNLTTSSTPLDFVSMLVSAGAAQAPSRATEVRYAVGAIGFAGATYAFPSAPCTDKSPRAVRFAGWTLNSNRNFVVYKKCGSYDLGVDFYDAYGPTSVTIAANTDTAPAVAVFNNRLHIFWRDRTTGAIAMRYYNNVGNSWTYALGTTPGIASAGAFDAYPFNGDLYVVYVAPGDDTVRFARCTETTYGCTAASSDWKIYGSNQWYDTGWYGSPGLAVSAGAGVNGSSAESLYVATRYPNATYLDQVRVLRITVSDSVAGVLYVPTNFPSYRSDAAPLGIEMRASALSGTDNYLYLVWNDQASNALYTSVLQNWSTGWFTRSTPVGTASIDGVAYWRHDSAYSARPIYATSTNDVRYKAIYGRY